MRRYLPVIAIFLLIAGMLAFVEARPQTPDPDSFYHAKMALMIRDHGFIQQFPWLSETVLADQYVDHHLLYHLLLVPFVTLFDPIVGIKVSAVAFALVLFATLYGVLKALKTPWPEWFTLAAALSSGFFHRMSLPRAPSLSLALLLLGIYFVLKRKPWPTFGVAFAFVWLYNGWPLLLVTFAAIFAADLVARRLMPTPTVPFVKTGLALLAGLAAGLVINPYFPANIQFDVLHIFKIGVLNYAANVPVGQEWASIGIGSFVSSCLLSVVVLAVFVALFFPAFASHPVEVTRARLLTVFSGLFLFAGFFVMSLKSGRYIEYAAPMAILAASALAVFAKPFVEQEILPHLRGLRPRWLQSVLCAQVGVAFLLCVVQVARAAVPAETFQVSRYQGAVSYIQSVVPDGEIIFHNVWDSSLILFYLDDRHRYLIGLDPRFMYEKNPERYTLWNDLVSAAGTDFQVVNQEFHSSVVFVDKRVENDFVKNMEASGLFQKGYEDDWTAVYELNAL